MPRSLQRRAVALLVAILATASTWFYVNRILRAQQISEAVAHNQPRGNLSDLYPRWLGARELLKHGRNPYSAEITREIQQGYYGRALDPARPDETKDQQGFAYPVYVVFLLAPTVDLPFDRVQVGFRWVLFGLAVATILLWLRVLHWPVACEFKCILIVLILGWWPMVQGIKLQQLSLLVAGLLAACAACLTAGWLFLAGGLLALATIKPQLAWPIVLWLSVWVMNDWRARRRFIFGFALIMLLLVGGSQFILPGWPRMFFAAIAQYHQYTQNQSVLVWLCGAILGYILEVLSVLLGGLMLWQMRREPAGSAAFGRSLALVLALTVLIVPMFAPYNQVLLVPAILALLMRESLERAALPTLPAIRLARAIGALIVLWPWIATLGLSAAYPWLTPEIRQKVWFLPFYTNFLVPVFVFGLMLLDTWMSSQKSFETPTSQKSSQNLRDHAPGE